MKVKVKLLGRYRTITGKSELEYIITNGDTIRHLIEQFIKKYPQIEKDKKFIMVSKNNTYTTTDDSIAEGDQITLTPPVVSGG